MLAEKKPTRCTGKVSGDDFSPEGGSSDPNFGKKEIVGKERRAVEERESAVRGKRPPISY